MKPSLLRRRCLAFTLPALVVCLALNGCKEPAVKVYDAPKETPSSPLAMGQGSTNDGATPGGAEAMPPMPGMRPPTLATPGASTPRPRYQTPAGWVEQPASGMRLASFLIADNQDRHAEVTVISLGRESTLLDNVNRWRKQLGLAAIGRDELSQNCTKLEVGGRTFIMADVAGTAPAQGAAPDASAPMMPVASVAKPGQPARILAVIEPTETLVWFTKMMGDDAVVQAERDKLKAFGTSLTFDAPTGGEMAASAPPAAGGLTWRPPAEWKVQPPGPMRLAQYLATPMGDAKPVEISVAMLPSQGGGLLANVNRWRAQLSLPPTTEADLQPALHKLKGQAGTEVTWLELSGKIAPPRAGMMGGPRFLAPGSDAITYGAIVSDAQGSWFFKMLGDAAATPLEKERFVAFLATIGPEGATAADATTPSKPTTSWYAFKAPPQWEQAGAEPRPGLALQYLTRPAPKKKPVEISWIVLHPGEGTMLAMVNHWREQLSLPPTTEEEINRSAKTVTSDAGVPVKWIELKGTAAKPTARIEGEPNEPVVQAAGTNAAIYGALLTSDKGDFLLKVYGDAASVALEKARFLATLKTIEKRTVPDNEPTSPPKPPAPSAASASAMKMNAMATNSTPIRVVPTDSANPGLRWTVPAAWKTLPAMSIRKATYQAGEGTVGGVSTAPTAAEIAVTAFPGDTGGMLGNVNRWREQLGLPAATEEDLKKLVASIPAGPARTASLVELVSKDDGPAGPEGMVVAVVRDGDSTWFFKLIGPQKVILAHRAEFVEMIASIR